MFTCPNCKVSLHLIKGMQGVFWLCPVCDGRSISLILLRKNIDPLVLNEMWRFAKVGNFPRNRACPACLQLMAEVPVKIEDGSQYLDVCTLCQFIWFDMGEYSEMPYIKELPKSTPDENIRSEEERKKIALSKFELLKFDLNSREINENSPEEAWHWLPGILGMPVELDAQNSKHNPWITWGLAALIVIISSIAFIDPRNFFESFALVPAKFDRYFGLTLLTSFFLHGSFFHLVTNLYFFMVFGDNVEEWLGKKRFLTLIFSATILGDILHILINPNSSIPCVGASGGISGVLAFYALQFPHARLSIFILRSWITLPAYSLFIIWIMFQFLGLFSQFSGESQVSFMAHIGGVCMGISFWLVTRKSWNWLFT